MKDALELYEKAIKAKNECNWEDYEEYMKKLKILLEELSK